MVHCKGVFLRSPFIFRTIVPHARERFKCQSWRKYDLSYNKHSGYVLTTALKTSASTKRGTALTVLCKLDAVSPG